MSGTFITFEGGEGSGKSTQIALLADVLGKTGLDCIKTREPGGSDNAERIRSLLVSGDKDAWDPLAETVLFYAARLDHVSRLIKPALDRGSVVLCDRFADSTAVYQGIGKGLTEDYVRMLQRMLMGNFTPDLTLIFDIDPETGLKRAASRANDETRFEKMDMEFHRKIRTGFLAIAEREPHRCAVINAALTVGEVQAQVMTAVRQHLGERIPLI